MTDKVPAPTPLPAFRNIEWMPRDIEVDRRENGEILLRSRIPLDPFERHMAVYLDHWARKKPNVTWLAQRNEDGGWDRVSYAEGLEIVNSLAQALLHLAGASKAPLAILSENSIEHALIAVAAMKAGIPIAPISPAYSLQSNDHAKLRYIFDLIKPGIVFVQNGEKYARALATLGLAVTPTIYVKGEPDDAYAFEFSNLMRTLPTSDVDRSVAEISPDTVVKLLFTSGSTGMPKAVINTQRMLCANVQMLMQSRPLPPNQGEMAVLDWLPWNHTMAGNGTFSFVLAAGHTLYIDDGRPVPKLMERTLNNLREVSPYTYTSSPSGYALLVTALEQDEELCRCFFKNLQILGYGGARLPDDLYDRVQALAVKTIGERIVFVSYYGATETAPLSTTTYWAAERTGLIGLPLPGVELKLVPVDEKYEIRQKSITVMPGYFGRDDLTQAAFDDEGYYKLGDLVTFADPENIEAGLLFSGRLAEEFKLLTGTFVPVGTIRVGVISEASPIILDCVVTGQDRAYVGLLIWLNLDACRLIVDDPLADISSLSCHPEIIQKIQNSLSNWNVKQKGASSLSAARFSIMAEAPSLDVGEITDKGYVNQRAVLQHRADWVERIYADNPDAGIFTI